MRAKYGYDDPPVGLYLQADPVGLWGGLNFYSYARDNPVNANDPLGLRPLTDCEKLKLGPYIPQEDLNNADLHDGDVPSYFEPFDDYIGITRGNDIYFRPGVYDPSTADGLALLGHELVHVGQYRDGMTWISYLWSCRRGYYNSKYEKPAYALQVRVRNDLVKSGDTGCECPKE